ncbi:MAG: HD domain-containing protein [Spirochaetales bacterium]
MWNPDLYSETLHFAAAAHEGQFVPGKTYSYVVHLVDVCMESMRAAILEEIDDPNLVMQCSLLHDTLEETAVTYEILLDRFGRDVAEGVRAISKKPDYQHTKKNLEEYIKGIAAQKREVRIVKLADRIVNLREPPAHWDMEKRKEYLEESRFILKGLKKTSPLLEARLNDKIYAYKRYIQE